MRQQPTNVLSRPNPHERTKTSASGSPNARSHPLQILLVEDNPINTKLVIQILERLEYCPTHASNGQEAVSLCREAKFDLILMDLQMPVLDGFDAAKQILANGSQAFIAALTANTSDQDRRQCREAGTHHFMPKPMRLADLQETIKLASERASRHA